MNEEDLAQWGCRAKNKQTSHIFDQLAASTLTKDCRIVLCKGKDKFSLFTPWRRRGEWTYGPTFSSLRHLILVRCQRYVPNVLPPGERPLCPMNGRLGSPQSRSGYFGKGVNLLPLPEFEPRIVYPQVPVPLNPSCRWTYVLRLWTLDGCLYTCGPIGTEGKCASLFTSTKKWFSGSRDFNV